MSEHLELPHAVAVVGMAGRFPGAATVDDFWTMLAGGREGLSRLDDAQLREAGVSDAQRADPDYVGVRGVLEGADRFDAAFFGVSPREAEVTDPQQRVFLECAWEAMEHAGHDGPRFGGKVGVYAGATLNTYMHFLYSFADFAGTVGGLTALIGNDKDYLASRVSYKLDLRGPALAVQTACSTSLVAVHLAAQALLAYQCDMALAGGVSIVFPQHTGYTWAEGGIMSPDGRCRAFDHQAGGTVMGSGVGVVALRRLEDAIADGDTVYAVIRGSAINNDGAAKVGYTAPSAEGQAAVIAEALAVAGVEPETVGYVEAHGTGTSLGDPIEVAALARVYGAAGARPESCVLGSLKGNLGPLDAAAGAAGLIKAVLALKHGRIPGTPHFQSPNPAIDFAGTPF
ncbi:MAG: polyketide synthase, partial [Gemmatimonadetes bacterium]|nr:polyketide synthase [Gemmatimonadota bacterium]